MAKIIKSNINSSGSYKSHGNLSSKHHSSSTTRKEKLKGGGSRAVTDSINSTKTINETQNYATTRSTTITSTRKTRSEYFIPLLSMPFWFVIIFLIMAMGTFNVMMDNNGLGKWELKEEYEIDNVYTLSELQDMQLDTPITELNNHTLREVFEGGNKININNYINVSADIIHTIIDDGIYVEQSVKETYIFQLGIIPTVLDADKIYARLDYKPIGNINNYFRFVVAYGNTGAVSYIDDYQTQINVYRKLSMIAIISDDDTYFNIQNVGIYFTCNEPNSYNVINAYVIYLNELGIDTITVEQMDYWYGVYQDILEGSFNNETKAALGTIDYRNPKMIDDDIVYVDYYHMTYEQQEKLGLPALNNLTTVSSVLVGGKYVDDDNVIQETPGIFPTLTKLITSVTDVIEWFSDNTTKLIRYVDKGYENIVGEKLNDTWKRTKNAWSWLRDQFGIVGGAS